MSISQHTFSLASPLTREGRTSREVRRAQADKSVSKRAIDLIGSALGILVCSPILVAVAVAVRLDSRGPVLFRQKRMGLKGSEFHCLKFRTMVIDAEQRLKDLESSNESAGGVLFKIKNDPRVTPLGRFLRRTSLDELPQLFNVFMGQMSLVGPRPLQLRDSEKLNVLAPDLYRRRLSVLPGVTGPWQIGGRSEVDSMGMVRLDLDYVDHWSLGTDIEILFKTIYVVAVGKGAC